MALVDAAPIRPDPAAAPVPPGAEGIALLRPLCDRLILPALLVDQRGAVLHMNPAASSILARLPAQRDGTEPAGDGDGRLASLFGGDSERELCDAMAAAATTGARRELVLHLSEAGSARCTVLPLPDGLSAIMLEPGLNTSRLSPDEGLARMAQRLLGAGADHAAVLDCLCGGVLQLLAVEGAAVAVVEDGTLRVVAATGSAAWSVGTELPTGAWLTGQVIERRTPAYSNDVLGDPRIPRDYAERFGARRLALAPMLTDDRVVGLLCAINRVHAPFTRVDSALLARIAERGALAMENAELLGRAKREREQAEAAADIAQVALAGGPAVEVGERLLAIIDRIAPSRGKALAVLDPHAGTLRFLATRGSSLVARGVEIPVRRSVAYDALELGEIRFIPDLRAASEPEMLHLTSPDAVTVFPLRSKGRTIGVLSAATAIGTPLPDDHLAAISRIASATALALDVMLLTDEEKRRRSREQLLAGALTSMEHPVFIVSTEGRIVYANAAARTGYGYDEREFAGMLLEELGVAPPTPAEQGALYSALDERGLWRMDTVHRRKDASCFPADVTWTLLRDDDGEESGIVVAVRDLTDDQLLAEQRRQTDKMATLGELVAGVAHEINNPLTGISAFAQMLLDEPLDDEQLESVRMIKRDADRAVGVIRDLLAFARKTDPRPQPISLNDVIERALRLRIYGFRAAGVEVVTELETDLPPMEGDEQKLQQVVLNLVVNAEQAMQTVERRVLTLRSFSGDGRVSLEVRDSGIGMDADVLKHVFEPFFTTKPEGAGTGLGLSVSYGIVQAHHGSIDVQSNPGVGTTFRISFPHVQTEPA